MKIGRNEKCSCGSGKKYKHCCLYNKDVKLPFILTKEVYERDFVPVYRTDGFKPKTFVEFDVVLPFHIPLCISRTVTLLSNGAYLSFRFDMVTANESYKYPTGENLSMLNVHKTKILMMAALYIDYEEFIGDSEKYYNEWFDVLLESLNLIVLSYIVSKKDSDCHYLTKEMLPSIVLVRTTNLDTWDNQDGLFMLHPYVTFEKEPLTEDEIQDFLRLQGVVFWDRNPFIVGEQHVLSARRYFKNGYYLEAVNFIQIGVEVLIRILFEEFLRNDGKTEHEIKDELEDTSFMAIVKKKMPKYLGGNWDVTNDTNIVGKWYMNTYELRNKATHRGIIPSFSEVDEAIFAAMEFRRFIVSRIKANKKKYPMINEYFE